MRSILLYILLVNCFFAKAKQGLTQKTYSVKQQQRDFNILQTTLLENTGNPFIYTDTASLLRAFDSVEQVLQSPQTDLELFRLYASLVSKIRCGHTQIFLSKYQWKLFFNTKCCTPADVKLVNEKLYSTTTVGKATRMEKGDEIVAINDVKIADLLAKMRLYFSSDGYNITLKDRFFSDFFFLYHFLAFGAPNSFKFDFINKNGEIKTIVLDPVYPSVTLMKQKFARCPFMLDPKKKEPGVLGRLRINKNENCCILTFPTFKHSLGKAYEKFLQESFERINRSKTEYIIVDVRNNLGGWIQSDLVTYLCGQNMPIVTCSLDDRHKPRYNRHIKKFNKYYRMNRRWRRKVQAMPQNQPYTWTKHSGTATAYANKTKKIIVLTNGYTFSAGALLAATLKDKCRAWVIGEKTGGSYDVGNTGQLLLKLPECKMYIGINPVYVSRPNTLMHHHHQGLIPDIAIEEPINWKTKDDPYLKAAYEYIEQNQVNIPEAKRKKMAGSLHKK